MAIAPNRRVVALAYDGLCTFEFGLVVEIFGLERPELDTDWYDFSVAAVDPGPLRAAGGITVEATKGLRAVSTAGTIVIPGWRSLDEPPPARVIDALRRANARGARLVSICSGVFLLAATGLLDGKRASTHWRYADKLRRMYPDVDVDPDVLYVDEGSIITSAGSAAGIDACMHLVRRDHGGEIANTVARRLVVPPHRDGGQAQYVPRPFPAAGDAPIARAMDWVTSNLHRPITVEALARQAAMSPRTFTRQFTEQAGTSPYKWLTRQRLSLARELLETTNDTVDTIAARSGFVTAATLRHHFGKTYDTTPTAYRQHFTRSGPGAPRQRVPRQPVVR